MLACSSKYDNSVKVRFTHNVTINVPLTRFNTVQGQNGSGIHSVHQIQHHHCDNDTI